MQKVYFFRKLQWILIIIHSSSQLRTISCLFTRSNNMFYKALKLSTFLASTSISNADRIWPQYSQQCDVTGPHFVDDQQTYGTEENVMMVLQLILNFLKMEVAQNLFKEHALVETPRRTHILKGQLIAEEMDGIVESVTKKKRMGKHQFSWRPQHWQLQFYSIFRF